MCLFHMYFCQEKALQCNMVIVHFSPKTVSSTLSNDVTVTSTRYRHAGAMENVTYTRTVQNCIPSSGVHLSSPIRLHRVYGIDSMGQKKQQKNASLKGWKHDTCVCIFDESVGRCRQYTMREGVAYLCQSHALIARSQKCELPTPV